MFLFRQVDEKDLTQLKVSDTSETLDLEFPAADCLSAQGLLEERSEWIVSDDTEHDGLPAALRGRWRPLGEFREVVQKRSLDTVLADQP